MFLLKTYFREKWFKEETCYVKAKFTKFNCIPCTLSVNCRHPYPWSDLRYLPPPLQEAPFIQISKRYVDTAAHPNLMQSLAAHPNSMQSLTIF